MSRKIHVPWAAGVLTAGVFAALALGIPKAVDAVYDRAVLHHIEYQDTTLNTYEVSYESFAEKLHEIARCNGSGVEMHSVVVQELDRSLSDEALTDIVNQELLELLKNQIVLEPVRVSAEHLESRELYTMYTEDEVMHGINYWKLCYEDADCEVTLYLDTEFHKLYSIELVSKRIAATDITEYDKVQEDVGNWAGVSEQTSGQRSLAWINYWELWDYEEYTQATMAVSGAIDVIYFDDNNSIELSEVFIIRDDKYGCVRRGIHGFADMTQL